MQADRPKWQGGTIFRYKISIGHESFEDCAECPVKSLDFDKFEGNKHGVLYSLDYLKKHATNKNEMMIAIQINRMTFGDSQSQPAWNKLVKYENMKYILHWLKIHCKSHWDKQKT